MMNEKQWALFSIHHSAFINSSKVRRREWGPEQLGPRFRRRLGASGGILKALFPPMLGE
jgi:hypothetical protein